MRKKTIIDISVHEFDELVRKTYGKKYYGFQQQDGCKERQVFRITVPVAEPNDYSKDDTKLVLDKMRINSEYMGVDFETWVNRIDAFYFKDSDDSLWWYRNFYPHVDMILNDLHSKGIIEAGEYHIDIDW